MTVYDINTLEERYVALQISTSREITPVHDLIRDILDTRGNILHKATSDRLPHYKNAMYRSASYLDDLLIDTMVFLPHNIPGYQICIKHPISGVELWYQAFEDGHPVYVTFDKWQPDQMVDPVIDRKAMLLAERSRSSVALEEIQEYEARGLSAVTEAVPTHDKSVDVELLQADGAIKVSEEPIDPFTD